MAERERWAGRKTFIMAAVGSAIGLGNLWRFPYVAAQNGGGAFLLPYFIALVTAGIPIMIIEYGIGIRYQKSANLAFGEIRSPFRAIGWVAILGALVINIYYCVILAWSWYYLFDSFALKQWATDVSVSAYHFEHQVLQYAKSDGPWDFVGIRWELLAGLAVTWIAIWAIIRSGLKKIGKILLMTVPFPAILVVILVVSGVSQAGAGKGLTYYLEPNWELLGQAKVWLAAYGQVFFSLSLGFGTMIAYSSFMPRNTEVPNSAGITSFANCSFSFLAGFAVFSVLGAFASVTNMDMADVITDGPGLAFVVYPAALAKLPWATGFAVIFFATLLLLGIDSAFSLLETVGAALSDKFGFSRTKATTVVAVVSFLCGLPFVTCAGLYWLDIIDHFINNYVITFVAICECIIVGYFLGINKFTKSVNRHAEVKLGFTYKALILAVTPIVLGVVLVLSFIDEVTAPFYGAKETPAGSGNWKEEYTLDNLLVLGVGVLVVLAVAAVVLSLIRSRSGRQSAVETTASGRLGGDKT